MERTTQMRPGADATPSVRDSGSTFIELLVSIVLLGTVGVAVLTALAASATGAKVHRELSDAQAWLATAGDAISETPNGTDNYVICAMPSDYQALVPPEAAAVNVIAVEYWDSALPVPQDEFGSVCQYATGDRLQRITLETTVDGVARTLAVLKRPALEPTQNTQPPPGTVPGGAVVPTPTPGLEGP